MVVKVHHCFAGNRGIERCRKRGVFVFRRVSAARATEVAFALGPVFALVGADCYSVAVVDVELLGKQWSAVESSG
jgi:hypothetical protein